MIAGVKFSYSIALLSVSAVYAIGLLFFVKNKAYEDLQNFSLPTNIGSNFGIHNISKAHIISVGLLLLLIVSYMVRIGSYSPVFQELDPYYYIFSAQQILVLGENPFDDQTAWYPEVSVNHRVTPTLSYLEAIWYSLYAGGSGYDNMILAIIGSMYPPIAAVLAIFFIYLLVSALTTKHEWGFVSAALAAFAPIFIYKLAAGEYEVQPYAFFAIAFFYAMYVLSLKKKDLRFAMLAGLGFAAVSLGSESQLVIFISILLFMILQTIAYLLKDENAENLRYFLISNTIVLILGPGAGSLLKQFFVSGGVSFTMFFTLLVGVLFIAVGYAIKLQLSEKRMQKIALAALLVIGLFAYVFTPVGDYIRGAGKAGFAIAEFKSALERTIAEQGVASGELDHYIGFYASTYDNAVRTILWPITSILGSTSTSATSLNDGISWIVSTIFSPISLLVNFLLILIIDSINAVLGTHVVFIAGGNNLLLLWTFVFWAVLAFSAYHFMKKGDDTLFILMLVAIMPSFIVGIVKAKYTIYSAVLLAIAIGFSLGTINNMANSYLQNENLKKKVYSILIGVGLFFVLLQFSFNGFAPGLLWGSTQPLYQNNPEALQSKFLEICTATQDPDVCAAAANPMLYADAGTNYQYNQKLCMLSIVSNYTYLSNLRAAPSWEMHAASFGCNRLSFYWVDSMEWIRANTEDGSRIISWWDYGHWINFFGQKNTVLRNEHASLEMIGAVADAYTDATPEELKTYMKAHDSKYALFDAELIIDVNGGGTLGAKYGALNYLACDWNNQTNVSVANGQSTCESDHLWESIFVSSNPCVISSITNQTGRVAYKIYQDIYKQNEKGEPEYAWTIYSPFYPPDCIVPSDGSEMDQNVRIYCQYLVKPEPTYCMGETTLADGTPTLATYYLNETYPNGNLKLNKAHFGFYYTIQNTYHFGNVESYTLFYNKDQVWLENGAIKSGYEDRKGKFYNSAIYNAVFFGELDGFDLVYSSPGGGHVKIFKIQEN